MALFGIIAVGFALIVVYAIVRAFQAQITFVLGAIVLSFCAYGVLRLLRITRLHLRKMRLIRTGASDYGID